VYDRFRNVAYGTTSQYTGKNNGFITLFILSFVLPLILSAILSLYKTSLLLNIEPLGPSVGPLTNPMERIFQVAPFNAQL
jgi:hypothetical protein